AGAAPLQPSPRPEYVRGWRAEGRAGEMTWLTRHADERIDPSPPTDSTTSRIADRPQSDVAVYVGGARSTSLAAARISVRDPGTATPRTGAHRPQPPSRNRPPRIRVPPQEPAHLRVRHQHRRRLEPAPAR